MATDIFSSFEVKHVRTIKLLDQMTQCMARTTTILIRERISAMYIPVDEIISTAHRRSIHTQTHLHTYIHTFQTSK